MATPIILADQEEISQTVFAETAEGFQNFLVKWDRRGEVFKIGFMAKREHAKASELKYYPVWIGGIVPVTVARQMLGDTIVNELYANPNKVFWCNVDIIAPAGSVLQSREEVVAA